MRSSLILATIFLIAAFAQAQPTPGIGEATIYHNFQCNRNIGWTYVNNGELNFCGVAFTCPGPYNCGSLNDNACSAVVGPLTRLRLLRHCDRDSAVIFDYSNTGNAATCVRALPYYGGYSYAILEDLRVVDPPPSFPDHCNWEQKWELRHDCNGAAGCQTFGTSPELRFVRDTAIVDNEPRLTDHERGEVGALWWSTPLNVRAGFTSTFAFTMRSNGGWWSPPGADGIAYVIQSEAEDAIGGGGGNMGYNGIRNAVVIEFDTWCNNWSPTSDPWNNHISVLVREPGQTASASQRYAIYTHTFSGFQIEEADIVYGRITNRPTSSGEWRLWVEVWLDAFLGEPDVSFDFPFQIDNYIELPWQTAWHGFTGATGDNWQDTRIREWTTHQAGAATAPEDRLRLTGTNLGEMKVGDSKTFGINTYGECGGEYHASPDEISVSCGNNCQATLRAVDNIQPTGTYECELAFSAAGDYTITVTFKGDSDSFTVEVTNDVIASVEYINGESTFSIAAGTSGTFVVRGLDDTGARITTEHETPFKLTGRLSPGSAWSVGENPTYIGNGKYRFTYTGTRADDSIVFTPYVGGSAVASTKTLEIVPGPFSLPDSSTGASRAQLAAGQSFEARLTPRDSYGNRIYSPVGGSFTTYFIDGSGTSRFTCAMSWDDFNRRYETPGCTPTLRGRYYVEMGTSTTNVKRDDVRIRVCSNVATTTDSEVSSLDVTVGMVAVYRGVLRDAHGNSVTGLTNLRCCADETESLDCASSIISSFTSVTSSTESCALYRGSYACTIYGNSQTGTIVHNTRVSGSDAGSNVNVQISAGPPAALTVSLGGSQFTAGTPFGFTVSVFDQAGNTLTGNFDVNSEAACTSAGQCGNVVEPANDDARTITCVDDGPYRLTSTLGALSDTADFTVVANTASVGDSSVTGTLLYGGIAGTTLDIEVNLRDAYGNDALVSNNPVTVRATPVGAGTFPSLSLNTNGAQITSSVMPTKVVTYRVEVLLNSGGTILDTATVSNPRITPADISLEHSTTTTNTFPLTACAVHTSTFQAYDRFDNALVANAPTGVCVGSSGDYGSESVRANGDGTYTVSVVPQPANQQVDVSVGTVDGAACDTGATSSVDFSFTAGPGSANAPQSCLVWSGNDSCDLGGSFPPITIAAGDTTESVSIYVRDACGNSVPQTETDSTWQVFVEDRGERNLGGVGTTAVAFVSGSEYSFDMTPNRDSITEGNFWLRVEHPTGRLAERRFRVFVEPAPSDCSQSSASGPGVLGGYIGRSTYVDVTARDEFGNARTHVDTDGSQFTVTATLACNAGNDVDEEVTSAVSIGSGMYRYEFAFNNRTDDENVYCDQDADAYVVRVTCDGDDITGTPVDVEVEGPVLDTATTVSPDDNPHELRAGGSLALDVQTLDTNGLAFTTGHHEIRAKLQHDTRENLVGYYDLHDGLNNQAATLNPGLDDYLSDLIDVGSTCQQPSTTFTANALGDGSSTARHFEAGTGFEVTGLEASGMTGDFTVAMVAKFARAGGARARLLRVGQANAAGFDGYGLYTRGLEPNAEDGTSFRDDGRWHSYAIAASATDNSAFVYVDGELKYSTVLTDAEYAIALALHSTMRFANGCESGCCGSDLSSKAGDLSKVMVFNRMLSARELTAVVPSVDDNLDGTYSFSTVLFEAGWWPFDITVDGVFSQSRRALVRPAVALSAPNSVASLTQTSVVAGNTVDCVVDAHDAFGNSIPAFLRHAAYDTYADANDWNGEEFQATARHISGSPSVAFQVAHSAGGEETWAGDFAPEKAGVWTVEFRHDGQRTAGTHTVSVAPAAADISKVLVIGAGADGAEAGQQASFSIKVFDTYNNERLCTGAYSDDVEVTISTVSTLPPTQPPTVACNSASGLYDVTYMMTEAGAHALQVTVDSQDKYGGDGKNLVISAGPFDRMKSTITCPGGATAGELATAVVNAKDAYDNDITSGGETLTVLLGSPVGLEIHQDRVSDLGDGSYSAEFLFKYLGGSPTVDVSLTLQHSTGAVEPGCDFTVTHGPLSAAHSVVSAFSTAVVAGDEHTISITARDAYQNEITSAQGLTATLTSSRATTHTPEVALTRDSAHYTCTFRAFAANAHSLKVAGATAGTTLVSATLSVSPGPAIPANTVLAGLGKSEATAGVTATLTAALYDAWGNWRTTGDVVTARLTRTGAADISASSLLTADGFHTLSYVATVAVPHQLIVRVNSVDLAPVEVIVSPGHPHIPSFDSVPTDVMAGASVSFTFTLQDAHGNTITAGPDEHQVFSVASLVGHSGAEFTATHEGGGAWEVDVTWTDAGDYILQLALDGPRAYEEVTTTLTVHPALLDHSTSQLVPEAGADDIEAGTTYSVRVLPHDEYGNAITANPQWDGTPAGATMRVEGQLTFEEGVPDATVGAMWDGAALVVTVTPRTAGEYTLKTLVSCETGKACQSGQVGSDQALTVVPAAADPTKCTLFGSGLFGGQAGEELEVFVTVRDTYSNSRNDLGDEGLLDLDVADNPSKESIAFRHEDAAVYRATYSRETLGQYAIAVTVEDSEGVPQHAMGSPFNAYISPGDYDPAASTFTLNPGTTVVAGSLLVVDAIPRDDSEAANVLTVAQARSLSYTVTIAGQSQGVFAGALADDQAADTDPASFRVSTFAERAGDHEVHVLIDGRDIAGSPFTLTVQPAELSADASAMSGLGLVITTAGQPTDVLIQARDQFNNARTLSDDSSRFKLKLSGPAVVAGSVVAAGTPGQYTGSYTATAAGLYVFTARLDDADTGPLVSETHVIVSPAPAVASKSVITGPETTTAGVAVSYTLTPRDNWDNAASMSGLSITASVTTSEELKGVSYTYDANVTSNAATFTLRVRPTKVGQYALMVRINGEDAEADNMLTVSHAAASAAHSQVTVTQAATTAGDMGELHVVAKDAFGNDVNTGDAVAFTATLTEATVSPDLTGFSGNDVSLGTAQRHETDLEQYEFSFMPRVAGTYSLAVRLAGNLVWSDSETASAGAISTDKSFAEGDGLYSTIAGDEASFTVYLRDQFGNPRSGMSDDLDVQAAEIVDDKGADESEMYTADVTSNGDGSYEVTWEPTKANVVYDWTIVANAETDLSGDYVAAVFPAALDPESCKLNVNPAEVNGVAAGQPRLLTITAYDRFDNRIYEGGHEMFQNEVDPDGPEPNPLGFADLANGVYTASRSITQTGTYTVSAKSDESNVDGSPFALRVDPLTPHWRHSTVTAFDATLEAGETFAASIHPYDQFGNDATTTSESTVFVGKLTSGSLELTVPCVRNGGDGTFDCSLVVETAAEFDFQVFIDTSPRGFRALAEDSNTVTVSPGDPYRLTSSASGDGLATATAGDNATFTIELFDEFSNRITEPEVDMITASFVDGVNPVSVVVAVDGDSLSARYLPTVVGPYQLTVTIVADAGTDLVDSQVQVLPAPTDLSKCDVSGEGYDGQNKTAGESLSLTIVTRDRFNNPRSTGGDVFVVTATHESGSPVVTATVSDLADGTYNAVWQPRTAGTYDIVVSLGGQAYHEAAMVPQTTVSVVPAATDVFSCLLSGTGSSAATAAVPTSFTITAYDRFNNARGVGGDKFNVLFTGNRSSVAVLTKDITDNGDGTYLVPYELTISGMYEMRIVLLDTRLQYVLVSVGAMDPSMTLVSGDLHGGVAGTLLTVTLQARDAGGNLIGTGGDTFTANTDPAAEAVNVTDNGDGTYDVQYRLKTAGSYDLNILADGSTAIANSPLALTIVPAGLSGETSSFTTSSTLTAGAITEGLIVGQDEYTNPRTEGGDVLSVSAECLSGNCMMYAKDNQESGWLVFEGQRDSNDGTYAVDYSITLSGQYRVCAVIETRAGEGEVINELIEQCVVLFVLPGPADADQSVVTAFENSIAGEVAHVNVTAYDAYGNLLVAPAGYTGEYDGESEVFTVFLAAQESYFGYFSRLDGVERAVYMLSYTAYGADEYDIVAFLGSEELGGDTNVVTVSPAATDPENSRAYLDDFVGVAGEDIVIRVELYDSYHNLKNATHAEAAMVKLSVAAEFDESKGYDDPNDTLSVDVNQDGDVELTFQQTAADGYLMRVAYGADSGVPVLGSPLGLLVKPNDPDADKSIVFNTEDDEDTVTVAGEDLLVNTTLTFYVKAVDRFDNPWTTNDPAAAFVASYDGAENMPDPVGNGVYRFDVALGVVKGTRALDITLEGADVLSEDLVVLPEAADAGESSVSCGMTPTTAGVNYQLTLQARDVFGNTLDTGNDAFSCVVSQDSEEDKTMTVTDHSSGSYTFYAAVAAAKLATAECSLDGSTVGQCGYDVVPADADALESSALAKSYEIEAGTSVTVTVQARDEYGNELTGEATGSFGYQLVVLDDFSVVTSGTATYTSNGQYEFEVSAELATTYQIAITLNAQPLRESPLLAVTPSDFDPTASIVYDFAWGNTTFAGIPRVLSIVSADRFGNPLRVGDIQGTHNFHIDVVVDGIDRGDEGAVFTDYGNGTFSYELPATRRGMYEVTVSAGLDEDPLLNSPLVWELNPRPPHHTTTDIDHSNVPAVILEGEDVTTVLTTRDIFANTIGLFMNYDYLIEATLYGPFDSDPASTAESQLRHTCPTRGAEDCSRTIEYGHKLAIEMQPGGPHHVSFRPHVHGYYTVHASIFNQPIVGSPFTLHVLPFHCPDADGTGDSKYRCATGECVESYDDCPVIPTFPAPADCSSAMLTYCAQTGTCVATASECPVRPTCTGTNVECWDGSCASELSACPPPEACPPGHHLCDDRVTCVRDLDHCTTDLASIEACPAHQPVRCRDLSCAVDANHCPTPVSCDPAGPSAYVCPDGTCAASVEHCVSPAECTGVLSFHCPDGSCAASATDCPRGVTCPYQLPVLCSDNVCRKTAADCPATACNSGFHRCPTGECVRNERFCGSRIVCPADAPLRCPDGSCRASKGQCAYALLTTPSLSVGCPAGFQRCPNGACVADDDYCPTHVRCPESEPVRCPDGQCRESATECVASRTCPPSVPFTCPDRTCAVSPELCPVGITCPPETPVLCADLTCRATSDLCIAMDTYLCPEGTVRCPGGECAGSYGLCPQTPQGPVGTVRCWDGSIRAPGRCPPARADQTCPEDASYRCPDFSCRARREDCPTRVLCPADFPVKCHDGTCAQTLAECTPFDADSSTCTDGFNTCPSGLCALSECGTPVTCPSHTPFRCFDGTCRAIPTDCPPEPAHDTNRPFMCPNGMLAASRMSCPLLEACPDSEAPVKCPNGDCVAQVDDCTENANPAGRCPPENPLRCGDGSCTRERWRCPENRCPSGFHKCTDGSCVTNSRNCPRNRECPFDGNKVLCADSSCGVAFEFSVDACPPSMNICPEAAPVLCGNKKCVAAAADCPDEITGCRRFQEKCWDGSCRTDCPDEEACNDVTETRCDDGSCRLPGQCPLANGCPGSAPTKCANGACVASMDDCPPTYYCPARLVLCETGLCQQQPVRCPDGTCAATSASCPPIASTSGGFCLSPTPIRCADGSCVGSSDECPAIASCGYIDSNAGGFLAQVRCPDGSCRTSLEHCPAANTCPAAFPHRCPNGACEESSDDCACGDGIEECVSELMPDTTGVENGCPVHSPARCASGLCVTDLDDCTDATAKELETMQKQNDGNYAPNGCPVETSAKCWDGSCVDTLTDCALPNNCPRTAPLRCADGSCVDPTVDTCPASRVCPGVTRRCNDGSCQADALDCPAQDTNCPLRNPVRCSDGTCVSSAGDCPAVTVCGADKPHSCADGTCVAAPFMCRAIQVCPNNMRRCQQDGLCRGPGANACDDVAARGSSGNIACPLSNPVRCESSGECVARTADCAVKPPQCGDGEIPCYDGSCALSVFECYDRAGRCQGDDCGCTEVFENLCFDGSCRSQCPPHPACPDSRPVRCGNFTCEATMEDCGDGLESYTIDPPLVFEGCDKFERMCADGCRPWDEECDDTCTAPALLHTVKPRRAEITIDPLRGSIAGVRTEQGVFAGQLHFPSGSLTRYDDPSAPTTIAVAHAASSTFRGSQLGVGGGTTAALISHKEAVSSPIVTVEVVDGGSAGFNRDLTLNPVKLRLPYAELCVRDQASDAGEAQAMCLGRLNGQTNVWECEDTPLAEVQTGVFEAKVEFLDEGQNVFAILQFPDIPYGAPASPSPSPGDGTDNNNINGGVVSGSVLAAAAVATGFSYVTWRLYRYRTKYRAWKAQRGSETDMNVMAEKEHNPQLVVNPMFLANQQFLQKRLADVEGGLTTERERAEDLAAHDAL